MMGAVSIPLNRKDLCSYLENRILLIQGCTGCEGACHVFRDNSRLIPEVFVFWWLHGHLSRTGQHRKERDCGLEVRSHQHYLQRYKQEYPPTQTVTDAQSTLFGIST